MRAFQAETRRGSDQQGSACCQPLFHRCRSASPLPFAWLVLTPFLGQHLKNLAGFVSHDVFAFRDRADQSAENWHPAESEVGTAIIDTDLLIGIQKRSGIGIVFDQQRSVGGSGNDAERIFFCHRELTESGLQEDRRKITSTTVSSVLTVGPARKP